MRFEVAVVGAGVAAASALIALARAGLRVVVIAPHEEPRFRIGETLAPVGCEELRELGVYDAFVGEGHLPALSKFSAWGSARLEEQYAWGSRHAAGWYLDRARFERFLWRHARRCELERRCARVLHVEERGAHWRLRCSDGGDVEAEHVLDCSGRSAIVGRQLSERRRIDKLVATYAVLDQARDEVEPTVAALIESAADGWYYSVIVPGNRLVVAWFTDSDLLPRGLGADAGAWIHLLRQSAFTWRRIESAEFEPGATPRTVDAATLVTTEFATPRFLAVGDAAASFDPLSSHGIATALWSGRKAAGALLDLRAGSEEGLTEYRTAFTAGIARYLDDQARIYAAETRFPDSPFWKRRGGNTESHQESPHS